jgi:hypothetical protein
MSGSSSLAGTVVKECVWPRNTWRLGELNTSAKLGMFAESSLL